MRAVEILSGEHLLLRGLLGGLRRLLQETTRIDALDAEAAAGIVQLLERFADGSHQDKEEDFLFPQLLSRAPLAVGRTVRQLLAVHESERTQLEELRARLEGAAYGDPLSLDTFVGDAKAYITFQRKHADCEDVVLFPLAQEFLKEADDAAIVAGFERTEHRYARLHGASPTRLAAELCARLGIEATPPTSSEGSAKGLAGSSV